VLVANLDRALALADRVQNLRANRLDRRLSLISLRHEARV
jgi:hypothetical protein